MKKWIMFLLTICLFCLATGSVMAEDDPKTILTKEKWKSLSDSTLTLNADGTGILDGGMAIEGTWEYNDPQMVFSYELYGSRTFELKLESKDGIWQLTNEEGAMFAWESITDEIIKKSAQETTGYDLQMNEAVTLPFVTFTLEKAELVDMVGGKEIYRPASEGYKFFTLHGTIENTYKGSLNIGNLVSIFTFNGEFNYSGTVNIYTGAVGNSELDPKTKAELDIYANIPNEMAESIENCSVLFSFNDNFEKGSKEVGKGTYIFHVTIDEKTASAAKEGPAFEKIPFEECPVLYKPSGISSVYESGSGSSSSNGKVTSIRYSFTSRKKGAKAEELFNEYTAILREEGFELKEGKKGTVIYLNNKELATITQTSSGISLNIVPGNENLTMDNVNDTPSSAAEKTYKMEEKIVTDECEIQLTKTSVEKIVYSNKTGKGTCHYYESTSGDPLYVVSGTFVNKGKKPVDINNIFAAVIVNGELQYEATVVGVAKKAKDFVNDVSPKKKVEFAAFAEIPDSVIKEAGKIQLKLGYTDTFSTRVVSEGGLPLFDYCDQILLIDIK